MAKPYIHAKSSARRYGGTWQDYIAIHEFMDSSKGTVGDFRHRALTHTTWFIYTVLPKVFGDVIPVGDKMVSVRDIGEQHVLEDYGGRFIPTVQDFFDSMSIQPWMENGRHGTPASMRPILKGRTPHVCD